jgi:sugar lactone lactonase YvrE
MEWRTGAAIILTTIVASCGGAPGPHRSAFTGSAIGSPPVTSPVFPGFIDPVGIAFDAEGEAWVADYRLDSLTSFPSSGLAARGRVRLVPAATVRSVGGPNELRFDGDGTLWVAGWDDGEIRGYRPGDLRTGSTPTVTIEGPLVNQPTDIAFDRTGTMWVANQATGTIVGFGADQIGRSGHAEPRVVLHVPGFGADTPEALAFDGRGRLWISSYYDDVVVALAPGQLASGAPQPQVRLDLPPDSGPIGLAVDGAGRLWVAEASRDRVVAFGKDLIPLITLMGDDVLMPHTVTFDGGGSAWLPCYNGVLARFDASRLQPGTVTGPDLVVS